MSCYSSQILDLFYNIQNTGRIIKPEGIGRAGSKQEGTVLEFSWRVNEGRIEDARFRTLGDVNAIAISSVVCTMIIGKTVEDVLSLRAEDIIEHLKDNKPNYLYLIDLALSALANTYENYAKKNAKENGVTYEKSSFAKSLRDSITQIENGEVDASSFNYDLSKISSEKIDEAQYLENLNEYKKALEDNGIEQSLKKLINGFDSNEKLEIKSDDSIIPNDDFAYLTKLNTKKPIKKDGRGRPRKERTPEEEAEYLAKLNAPKKGRGRPKKERTPEELEEEKLKLLNKKQGRGRPRKERTPEEEAEYLAKLNAPKKGRGRPRKNDSNVSLIGAHHIDTPAEVTIDSSYKESKSNYYSSFFKSNNTSSDSFKENTYIGQTFNKVSKGRGRPRKERTPEEEAEYLAKLNTPKKGRGRPKKIVETTETEIGEKRGRGRPRKTVDTEINDVPVLKKQGRGRPRKEPIDKDTTTNIVKQGRGRPRKERTPEELEAERLKLLNKKPGRGRPRKERTPEEEAEYLAKLNAPKKGRGRPRKDTAIVIQTIKPIENYKSNVKTESVESNNYKKVKEDYSSDKSIIVHNNEVVDSDEAENKAEDKAILSKIDLSNIKASYSLNKYEPENENSFAPAQNKYGVGKYTTENTITIHKQTLKRTKITKSKSLLKDTNDIDNNEEINEVDSDIDSTLPLSENINKILSGGGSVEDALKALLNDDDINE